jgi:hypothetical protein
MFRKQFYFVASGLKILGHGKPDSNLESSYISATFFLGFKLLIICTLKTPLY